MNVGEMIKSRRLELGMTQEQLAKKTGYKTRGAINKIESGAVDVNQTKLQRFAKALDCTPAYFIGTADSKKSATNDYHQKVAEILSQIPEDKKEEFLEYLKAAVKMLKD